MSEQEEEAQAQASEGWMMSYGQRLTGPRAVSNLKAALNGFDAGWAARAAPPAGASAREPTLDKRPSRRLANAADSWVRASDDSDQQTGEPTPDEEWQELSNAAREFVVAHPEGAPEPTPLPEGARMVNDSRTPTVHYQDTQGRPVYVWVDEDGLNIDGHGEYARIDVVRYVLSRMAAKAGQ